MESQLIYKNIKKYKKKNVPGWWKKLESQRKIRRIPYFSYYNVWSSTERVNPPFIDWTGERDFLK